MVQKNGCRRSFALFYYADDLIPDLAPLVGYMDDLGVIAATLKFLGHELIPYYNE